MLKSSAPAAVVEQDPLEYYDQLTAQIEVLLLTVLLTVRSRKKAKVEKEK